MPRIFPIIAALLFLQVGQHRSAAADLLRIEKLAPFASSGSVRIDCLLESDEGIPSTALTASITHAKTGQLLWQGTFGQTNLTAGKAIVLSQTVSNLKPELWSPSSPALYNLKVTAMMEKKLLAEQSARFGFRSFESRNGQFLLNGRPIFLRGLAINPPGRTIPPEVGESRAFAESYVRFLKRKNVNTIRLTHDSQVWFDVCDELGMLVYQGQYGSPLGADAGKRGPPADFEKSVAAYKSLFETYARHPSILIYVLSNELPVSGARGRAFHEFLTRACAELNPWDPTRLIIGNVGYGEGREGDICDVHRYWGWYYNTFLTYYNLRDNSLFGDPAKNQPITFTECVGTFTGPSGEFNLVVRKQLGAQLNWTGHSPNQREDALRYQSFIVKQATESFRRLRALNPRLSGLMPFTILFDNWSGITSFDQMKAKPAMDQLALSYQPVLLSWELWTPQVYAGSTIHPIAHVINDAEDGSALTNAVLLYELHSADGRKVMRSQAKLPNIPYYDTWSQHLAIKLPANWEAGDYHLSGKILSAGRLISENQTELFVAGKDWNRTTRAPATSISLYDPSGKTGSALRKLGIRFTTWRGADYQMPVIAHQSPSPLLIIGERGWDLSFTASLPGLKHFVESGGRILCLQQQPDKFDTNWLREPITFFTASANSPTYPPASRPFTGNMNINPERPDHPVFAGLDRQKLSLWSDYTGWDQTKPGFPQLYPVTTGFKFDKPESLADTAILADYDRGLEGIALCEMFSGKGSVILCGFDLISRSGLDPAADRLLLNLVRHAASTNHHEIYPPIETPIQWGNYASERGILTGPVNGLVLNASWVKPPGNLSAKPLTQEEGAWNTRPGDQFAPHGRSPFGPYGYSTGSSLKDLKPDSATGSGFFWAQIPAGKTDMVTTIENPSKQPGELIVTINDASPSEKVSIPAGQTMDIHSSIPPSTTNLCVRYTGTKKLVLLRTAFEQ
jgi:hypothetical protein